MNRYIDKGKALAALYEHEFLDICSLDEVSKVLNDLPPADVEPVRHGKWEQVDEQPYFRKHFHRMCCSVCRHEGYKSYPYCPHCGSKMDGEEQEHGV